MTEILRIDHLQKTFFSQKNTTQILRDVNLRVKRNEFLCILGPSGCGKTTLLRCVAGFEPFEGSVVCNGKPVRQPSPERIMVFQDYNQLFPWKTVRKNIQYVLRQKGVKDKQALKSKCNLYLEKVGLAGKGDLYPHELSGGMKQRAAIAKALVLEPELILMDEPFAALDAITRNILQKELMQIWLESDITVIFVTHNIQEAIVLGSRILLMGKQGEIIIDKQNELDKPATPASKGYGEMWDLFSAALEAEATRQKE